MISNETKYKIFVDYTQDHTIEQVCEKYDLNYKEVSELFYIFDHLEFEESERTEVDIPMEDINHYIIKTDSELLIESVEKGGEPDTSGEVLFVSNDMKTLAVEFEKICKKLIEDYESGKNYS